MNTNKLNKIFAILSTGLFLLVSCSKDKKTIKNLESDMQNGSWKITNFNDSGTNETANFSGYNFTFNDDGSLKANNGSTEKSGTWSITDSETGDDDNSSELHFNISFGTDALFNELNDDWEINSHSSSKLELQDISGGNGTTDLLTFDKN